jgi:hypothetical protein
VTDENFQTQAVSQLFLQLLFPQAGAATIAATGISQDENFVLIGKKYLAFGLPPLGNDLHGKLWGIRRTTDINEAQIMVQVINAVRDRFAQGILIEIMIIHFGGLLAPTSSVVFEVANQFLLLGIHADHGPSRRQKRLLLRFQILELLGAIWVRSSTEAFEIGFQRVVPLHQQSSNGHMTHRMPGLPQLMAQMPQAAPLPLLFAHGVTGCFVFH